MAVVHTCVRIYGMSKSCWLVFGVKQIVEHDTVLFIKINDVNVVVEVNNERGLV